MARLPRFFIAGLPLHIVQRGNNRNAIFSCPADYAFLHETLTRLAYQHGVAVHAYVLMTNHLHLLATPSLAISVPKTMQALGRLYVARYNWRYGRTGTLWEGRYRATIVEDARYLIACMRYIELNPVRAELVTHPAEYRWSSFRANARGVRDTLVEQHTIYRQLGACAAARQVAYRALFDFELPDHDIDEIRDATQHAWALGSDDFRSKVGLQARRAQRSPIGRPPKRHCAAAPSAPRDAKHERG